MININNEINKLHTIEGYSTLGLCSQKIAHLQYKLHALEQSAPTSENLTRIKTIKQNIEKWANTREQQI